MSRQFVLFDVERRAFVGGGDPIFFDNPEDVENHATRLQAMEEYRPEPRQFDLVGVRGS